MFNRSFVFLISFITTFVVGFFVWNYIFLNFSENNPQNFTASLSNIYQDEDVILTTNLEQEEVAEVEKVEETEESMVVEPQESLQDTLDDIQEKLDVIQQQVVVLITEQNPEKQPEEQIEQIEEVKSDKIENVDESVIVLGDQNLGAEDSGETATCVGQININTASTEDLDKIISIGPVTAQKIIEARPFCMLNDLLRVNGIGEATLQKIIVQGCAYAGGLCGGGGGGGGGVPDSASVDSVPVVYPKILISEVQIYPIEQRFVELYNPNSTDINLTSWYLQRKDANDTSWGSFVSSTHFDGKIIPANGYFLISKEIIDSDILLSITLSADNSLALKNPDREISDEISWSEVADNLSWCYDFDLCLPTPKVQNVKYVEPEPEPEPEPPADTAAPEVSFSLTPTQTALEFPVNFTITDISSTTTPSGLAAFNFRWKEESEGVWREDGLQEILGAPISLDLVETVSGSDGQVFSFQAMATDINNNSSAWLPATPVTTTISMPVVLKNILINEIQISPIEQRFVELYNPNNYDVDLAGYYLQRKTATAESWGSFVSSTHFDGKIIPANGYFLISREIDGSDILLNITLSDNNSLALKNSDREIIDKVGWGLAIDPEGTSAPVFAEGQSISRMPGVDTDDNSIDFVVIDTPTPKGQ